MLESNLLLKKTADWFNLLAVTRKDNSGLDAIP